MAATDQVLAIGLVWGVLRECVAMEAAYKREDDVVSHPFWTAYLLIQQVIIATHYSDSFRGFLYVLAMPIGLYKVARVVTHWIGMLWFSQCFNWWKRHTPEWRDGAKAIAVGALLIVAACFVYGVDNGCNRDVECDDIE
jgi:hypothetical protein